MSNLTQTLNKVKVEGILAECNIDYRNYTRDGQEIRAIGGEFSVLVRSTVDGVPQDLMIPIRVFSNEYTKSGKQNPAFTSIENVKNNMISIAAAGGEEKATKVRITNGDLTMNEYYDGSGRLVSYPRVNASFISEVTGNFNPEASFEIVMAVDSVREVVDADGIPVEPERLAVSGSIVKYNGDIDCIELIAIKPTTITGIRDYWNIGDTVKLSGKLNFTYSTVEVTEAMAFGETTKKQTRRVSELIIESGSAPFEGEAAINLNELKIAKAERLNRLENERNKNKGKSTPAPSNEFSTDNLGF